MDSRVLQTQKWLNDTYGNVANFPKVDEDGITGNSTFHALIYALQIEIGVENPDGIFGKDTLRKCPTLRASLLPSSEVPRNIIYILQGSLWCKGISPGGFTGVFGPLTANAISEFQTAAGITADKVVYPYVLQGIMNTDSYSFQSTEDIYDTYRHEIQMGLNQNYGATIGLIAPNGLWERKSHKNLIKAIQIEWGASVDGSFGNDTLKKAPTLSSKTNGYVNSKRLLQWCLTINGFYPGSFNGTFDANTYNSLYAFQEFVGLGADGLAAKEAAQKFGFPPSATIYFCVDYDVLMADIEGNILPWVCRKSWDLIIPLLDILLPKTCLIVFVLANTPRQRLLVDLLPHMIMVPCYPPANSAISLKWLKYIMEMVRHINLN